MRNGKHIIYSCGALAAMATATASLHADEPGAGLLNRFEQHIVQLESLDDGARTVILNALRTPEEDRDDEGLLVEALVLVSEPFRAGLDAYDDEDYARCMEVLDTLAGADDPFVQWNARAFAVKALVHADRLVDAERRLDIMLEEVNTLGEYTFAAAELTYMLGYCQLQNLKHDEAQATLESFLRHYGDASPRLVVTARQMLAELARRVPESIGEVADLMVFAEKRLGAADSSERVRESQNRIVELLDKLIEKVEQQEQQQQQSAAAPKPKPKPGEKDQSQPQPADAEKDPTDPQGGSADAGKQPGRQVTPGEAWGGLPQAEREKVLQALRERFPGRYRALVEQYYQTLAEEP